MNCRDDGYGARRKMVSNEGGYHHVTPDDGWHSLPEYIEIFINKFFLIL
jgi:hypothetical protein